MGSTVMLVAICAGCSSGATAVGDGRVDLSVGRLDAGRVEVGVDSAACVPVPELEAAYGEVPGLKSANSPWNETERQWEVSAHLEGASGPRWELRLHPGRGQLPSRLVAPEVYEIGGGDSRMEDCAVCSFIGVERPGGTAWFMADSGILTILSIERGGTIDVIEGYLQDATFKAVELSPAGKACDSDDQCGNTTCGGRQCLVQAPTDSCGTSIGRIQFRTP